MFTWVGSKISSVLDGYILSVVTSLSSALTPIALTTLTIWVSLYGWAIMRGQVQDSIPDFLWKTFKIGLVLTFALQSGVYATNVADVVSGLSTGVASTLFPASLNTEAISSPYALLDRFNDQASVLVYELLSESGVTRLDLLLASVACSLGNVVFLCIAMYTVTLAKVLQTFVIAVGPVFILCLAWRPTARFFDSWLSMLLNCVVLTWFSFFSLGLSIYMGQAIVQVVQDQGGFTGSSFNVVGESLRYCIVMLLMAIVCFQAPTLASALTGGASVQQGIQMVQNVVNLSGSRSSAGTRSQLAPAVGGGAGRDATGLRPGAGPAPGRMATGTAAMARRGGAAVRMAAYRMAALRGNA